MIIPRPAHVERLEGAFAIGPALNLRHDRGAGRPARLLREYLGDRPLHDEGPPVDLRLAAVGGAGPEGYELEIRPDGVIATAPAEAGLFHAVQTLRQLLPPAAAGGVTSSAPLAWPCLRITDRPRLPWRGMMLDVARHFMPLSYLYELVDQLAMHKLNVLHLHLTDDQGWRIEIDGWPRLTSAGAFRPGTALGPGPSAPVDGVPHGGYYTQAELRELAGFASARGVTIVPEIEMPGHVRAALAAYPGLGNGLSGEPVTVWTNWGVSEDILGVSDEVLAFCKDVLTQTMAVFPSRYVHIGGDECPTTQWTRSPAAQARAAELGLANPALLHGWFVGQMRAFIASHGRETVCWDESGEQADVPGGVILTAWRDSSHGAAAVARGHQVIMAPHLATYLDYAQSDAATEPPGPPGRLLTLRDVYAFDPLGDGLALADGARPGVIGTQAQVWTEYAPTPAHVAYLVYPRLCALADTAWSAAPRDFAGFEARMRVHAERLRAAGVPAMHPSADGAGVSGAR